MSDFSKLTDEEQEIVKKLNPKDSIVRTLNFDHDGNAHVLLKWPAKYVVSKGIVPPKMEPHDIPKENGN
jgi:hypothetical protein